MPTYGFAPAFPTNVNTTMTDSSKAENESDPTEDSIQPNENFVTSLVGRKKVFANLLLITKSILIEGLSPHARTPRKNKSSAQVFCWSPLLSQLHVWKVSKWH